jgi:hypothetical protein
LRSLISWLALVAIAGFEIAKHPAFAQSATAPDAAWIRLNGTQKLTQSILPLMAQKSGQTSQTIATVPLLTHENHSIYLNLPVAGLVGYGVIVDTWLSDVELDAPIDGNDVTAKFLPPTSGASGRLMTWFDLTAAEVRFKIHVQMRPVATGVPKEALALLSFHRIFQIEVNRLTGSMDFRLGRQGNGIVIEEGSQYFLQLGSVTIDNPGLLQQTADFVLGFDRLFKIAGATSTNQAVTKITNALLLQSMDMDGDLRAMMNNALKAVATQGFPQQELSLPNGGLMMFGATFAGLRTADNYALSGWNLQLDARPDNKAPGIAYAKQPRAMEDVGLVEAAGDAQVFMPYTTVELAAFEMIQAGWMLSIPVQDPDGGGPLKSFNMNLIPTAVPRVRPDPAAPSNLLLECGVRMEDATVGTVSAPITGGSGPYPVPRGPSQPIDINVMNATANARLHLQFGSNAAGGIFARLVRVDLLNLTGDLRYATASASVAPMRAQIEAQVNAALQARGGAQIPLVPRAMTLPEGMTLALGTPAPGQGYMRLPLTINVPLSILRVPAPRIISP